jgi:EpsI family protein
MLGRRDLLLSLPLIAAAGSAFALTPRNRLTLLGDTKLEDAIPLAVGSWEVTPSNAVILPEATKGSLADELYSQTVSRLYLSPTKLPVMMVIAYGSTQSDQLQLHRPEACYAAVGFEISGSQRVDVPLGTGASAQLPARELVATSNDRIEPILYWTRVGDFLPTSGNEQRMMKLRTEMQGYVADGVLVRMSTVAEPNPQNFQLLQEFARELLQAVKPALRPALGGRPLAARLVAAG